MAFAKNMKPLNSEKIEFRTWLHGKITQYICEHWPVKLTRLSRKAFLVDLYILTVDGILCVSGFR